MGPVLGAGEALDVSQRRCARARPWQLKSSESRGPSPGGSGGRILLPARRHGFDPWSGKIPHAAEQLSLGATTTKPVLWSPGAPATELTALEPVQKKRRHCNGKPASHS